MSTISVFLRFSLCKIYANYNGHSFGETRRRPTIHWQVRSFDVMGFFGGEFGTPYIGMYRTQSYPTMSLWPTLGQSAKRSHSSQRKMQSHTTVRDLVRGCAVTLLIYQFQIDFLLAQQQHCIFWFRHDAFQQKFKGTLLPEKVAPFNIGIWWKYIGGFFSKRVLWEHMWCSNVFNRSRV